MRGHTTDKKNRESSRKGSGVSRNKNHNKFGQRASGMKQESNAANWTKSKHGSSGTLKCDDSGDDGDANAKDSGFIMKRGDDDLSQSVVSVNDEQLEGFYAVIKPKEFISFDEDIKFEDGWHMYTTKGFVQKNEADNL